MNEAKWDAIAGAFERGELEPANGRGAWHDQAFSEATTIRRVLPDAVDTLYEVGCGVGRLTPYLALLFPRIIAVDTSPVCRRVTAFACQARRNVTIRPPDPLEGDAALVWGNLFDEDWTPAEAHEHRSMLRAAFPLVLEGNAEAYWLHERLA